MTMLIVAASCAPQECSANFRLDGNWIRAVLKPRALYDAPQHMNIVSSHNKVDLASVKRCGGFRRWLAPAAVAAAMACAPALFGATTCDVRSVGAKGDGATKDTAAIQSAIDACERRGGGVVTLRPGTYLSAPIVLKNNITLHLDDGATLQGSDDDADYVGRDQFSGGRVSRAIRS